MADETHRVIRDGEAAEHLAGLFASGGPLPLHGPYGPGRTEAAADLIAELARYLNYATQQPAGLPHPATVARVWSSLGSALAGLLDETLVYTARRLDLLAGDDLAYVDGLSTTASSDAVVTAREAIEALGAARARLDDAARLLAIAARHANRIGLRDQQRGEEVSGG